MKLSGAKLCLECDEVFSKGRKCPACSSILVEGLDFWVPPLRKDRDELRSAAEARNIPDPWWWRLPLIGKHFRPLDIAY